MTCWPEAPYTACTVAPPATKTAPCKPLCAAASCQEVQAGDNYVHCSARSLKDVPGALAFGLTSMLQPAGERATPSTVRDWRYSSAILAHAASWPGVPRIGLADLAYLVHMFMRGKYSSPTVPTADFIQALLHGSSSNSSIVKEQLPSRTL